MINLVLCKMKIKWNTYGAKVSHHFDTRPILIGVQLLFNTEFRVSMIDAKLEFETALLYNVYVYKFSATSISIIYKNQSRQ